MFVPFSTQFEAYVAPARGQAAIWRLLTGICIALLAYAAWSTLVISGYGYLSGKSAGWARSLPDAATPQTALLLLATFPGMALGAMLAARLMHGRAAATLFGRSARVLHDFALTAAAVTAVYSVTVGIWIWRFDGVPNLAPGTWLLLLPLGLLGIAVQSGAEELVFRGYLLQQLAARFRSPFLWLLLPSLLFGIAHYDPGTAGGNIWYTVAATTLFGLAAADLTARTGSIGAAWGFHFANNIAALLIVAVKGTIPGLALYTTPYGADDPALRGLILLDMAALVAAWLLARRLLQR